ncbi:hypothetical protein [Pantoea rodasii]|nr:hypothetical protein [Pantoea rodasii]
MYIRLDLFADMLIILPRELLQATRADGMLGAFPFLVVIRCAVPP